MRGLPADLDESRQGEDDQAEENRLTLSLAGLTVALALVIVGLLLFTHLRDKARIEDCLLAGRLNCDAVLLVH
ncbi:MAG TPA: hypothetical protein VGC15_18205 [Acetobacteraceae bacterium]